MTSVVKRKKTKQNKTKKKNKKKKSIAGARGNLKAKTTPLITKLTCGRTASLEHVPAIKWGRENEEKAFSGILSKDRNCKLTRCGLHARTKKESPALVTALIGLCGTYIMWCSYCVAELSVVEIKCRYCMCKSLITDI